MTVSRVINGKANVSEATRRRVMRAVDALRYVPNVSARALATERTYRIALLYANPSRFYLSELLVGALDALGKQGHQLLVHHVPDSESPTAVAPHLQTLRGRFDGVLVPPPLSDYANVRDFLRGEGTPAVFVSSLDGDGRALAVGIDDRSAAAEVTRHLLELGHSRIGFVKGHPNQFCTLERLRGYGDALAAARVRLDPRLVEVGTFTYESGRAAALRLLSRTPRPTAIFASNDDMAAGALSAAASRGILVPEQLSIAGFDDSPLASEIVPRLTTVKQPLGQIAALAVERLLELFGRPLRDDAEAPTRILLPHRLIRGASTATAPSTRRAR